MESADIIFLLLAFAGGIIGALLGGLNIFILCGISAIVGTTYLMATGDSRFNEFVTWGPLLGPHITFAGAVAGAAYSSKINKLKSGRDILTPLFGMLNMRILMISGLFGVLGTILKSWLDQAAPINGYPAFNSIALSLVITGIIARVLYGRFGIFGKVKPGEYRWSSSDESNIWSQSATKIIIIGIIFGLPAAFINLNLPGSTGLVFGIAAVSLILLQFGKQIPVTHHIVLAAEYGALASGSLWWGVFFAVLSAILGELFAGIFLIHGDTHIDPPAIALVIIFSLAPILILTSLFSTPTFISIVSLTILCITGFLLLRYLKSRKKAIIA